MQGTRHGELHVQPERMVRRGRRCSETPSIQDLFARVKAVASVHKETKGTSKDTVEPNDDDKETKDGVDDKGGESKKRKKKEDEDVSSDDNEDGKVMNENVELVKPTIRKEVKKENKGRKRKKARKVEGSEKAKDIRTYFLTKEKG